ncbi:MAG: type III pantothenate kinase [Nocardioidaceae bacterium]
MALLCVAVENTDTLLGRFDAERLTGRWRLATDQRRTADEWGVLVKGLIDDGSDADAVAGICISSAVPVVLQELRRMAADYFPSADCLIVGPGVKTGLPVLMDNPREVGTDRIVNALAALELVGGPCIVVDCGTATTFDVVTGEGQYVGGAIAPGIAISLAALAAHGAQLRQVELAQPRTPIAKNTVEALQSGAVYGFAGQVDGIVGRMREQLGLDVAELEVIATGALAPAVLAHCESVTRHQPDLTLHGLRLIYSRNRLL